MIDSRQENSIQSSSVNCILFSIAGVPFALDAFDILSISRLPTDLVVNDVNSVIVGASALGKYADLPLIYVHGLLGGDMTDFEAGSAVLVLPLNVESGSINVGLLVDHVDEVAPVGSSSIRPTPWFGRDITIPYISKVISINDDPRFFLQLTSLLPSAVLGELSDSGNTR